MSRVAPGLERRSPRTASAQRGVATVLAVTLAGVLMVVGVAVAWLAGTVVAHRRAQSAADLAALAGATAHQHGRSPCAAARSTAAGNQGEVVGCRALADDVWVQVRVRSPPWWGVQPLVEARAHAGPAP